MTDPEIAEMTTAQEVEIVRDLLRLYIGWLFATFPEQAGDLAAYFSPERRQQALDEVPIRFLPPQGVALIARLGGTPVGCVLGYPLAPGVAEMKRLFVLPQARGRGLGRALVEALAARMADRGHPVIRLDTAVFLTEAIALYRSAGFVEIAPYVDLPPGSEETAVFMERRPPDRETGA